MTIQETKRLIFVMKTISPKMEVPSVERTPKFYNLFVETWFSFIGCYSYDVALTALKKYYSENKFIPGPNELIDEIKKFMPRDPNEPPSVEEAWTEVNDFIRSHGHTNAPKLEEYSNPAVCDTVNSLGWLEICTNENIEATRAHFYRSYTGYAKRRKDENAVKQIISNVQYKQINEDKNVFKLIESVSNAMDVNKIA